MLVAGHHRYVDALVAAVGLACHLGFLFSVNQTRHIGYTAASVARLLGLWHGGWHRRRWHNPTNTHTPPAPTPTLQPSTSPTNTQFGTPHFGIAALIPCPTPPTLSCTLAARAAKAGIYTRWAQAHLVQAQYFRDPARLDEFLLANTFVRDLNAEGGLDDEGEPTGREHGGRGLGGVENVVAVAFEDDRECGACGSGLDGGFGRVECGGCGRWVEVVKVG